MYRSFISLRYLRARRTNLIGMTGIFLGVGALILILSIMSGFIDETKKTIRGSLADVIIAPWPTSDGERPDAEDILSLARSDPRVEGACAQLVWFALISAEGREFILQSSELPGVQLVGVDLEQELGVTELHEALVREPQFGDSRVEDPEDPFAPPPGYRPSGRPLQPVVLGEQLFRHLYLRRGSVIDIVTAVPDPTAEGGFSHSNTQYVVAGTFRTGENDADLTRIYMPREELADLLGGTQAYTQVLVKLKNYKREGLAVRDDFAERLLERGLIKPEADGSATMQVRTWEQFRRIYLSAVKNEKRLMAIMLSLVLIVAGFTVFAILSMMVSEKRRDIGVLCALGATRGGIMRLFLMIGFWNALIGASLGGLAGTWLALEIESVEGWIERTFGIEVFDSKVYDFDHIPTVVNPTGVAIIVTGAFLCTLLFAALPAWRAARMHPIDALRYE